MKTSGISLIFSCPDFSLEGFVCEAIIEKHTMLKGIKTNQATSVITTTYLNKNEMQIKIH